MHQRGQVTVFIVVGIVLLFIFGALYWLISSSTQLSTEREEASKTVFQTQPVQQMIENCLQKSTEKAILELALQGGYSFLPEHSTTEYVMNAPYYLFDGETRTLSGVEVQRNLEELIILHLSSCFTFDAFPGMSVTAETPRLAARIGEAAVISELEMDTVIQIGGQEAELHRFSARVPVRLRLLLATAGEILGGYEEHDAICMTCMGILAFQHDLDISAISGDEGTLIAITDEQNFVNGEPVLWRFTVQ